MNIQEGLQKETSAVLARLVEAGAEHILLSYSFRGEDRREYAYTGGKGSVYARIGLCRHALQVMEDDDGT
jgi:hypothetical protein